MTDFSIEDIPKSRQTFQKYIFTLSESPLNTPHLKWSMPNGFFNWTFTYRLDSDILLIYTYNVTQIPRKRDMAAGKRKEAAWFVSFCNAKSGRDSYVRVLQKYMDVDVYGACGTLKCHKRVIGKFADFHYGDPCLLMVEQHYKFYLAFENRYEQDKGALTQANFDGDVLGCCSIENLQRSTFDHLHPARCTKSIFQETSIRRSDSIKPQRHVAG